MKYSYFQFLLQHCCEYLYIAGVLSYGCIVLETGDISFTVFYRYAGIGQISVVLYISTPARSWVPHLFRLSFPSSRVLIILDKSLLSHQ